MTTAHRPTFDPARGKEALRGPAYHQRLLPAYTQLKFRQSGQGGDADREVRDLRAELLAAEATHFAKIKGGPAGGVGEDESASASAAQPKLLGGATSGDGDTVMEDSESKLVQILEETRDMDADDSDEAGDGSDGSDDDGGGSDDDDDDDSSDDDDDDAELQRELDRIRRERTEKREKEVSFLPLFFFFVCLLTCNVSRSENAPRPRRKCASETLRSATRC
ncbi:Pre-mRNA-splicing factor Cwf15/Cwc15 [Lasiosphaeria ovina]|uniref:Pre-mRNA-splicing factor Cwf15/Cwc15 n=1 Tax=Lasiosphaeria ovina TaxID=92902 RepID=A0AAE0KMJ6_9PEZI|nr:Pre-mRNA-splicing factor Cwf15/Cwc15 [Lasiosphaeria ovina]